MTAEVPRIDVTRLLAPERDALVELLRGLDDAAWRAPTECPAWTVKGLALHILGDDLSLLSRQRDEATNGLIFYAESHPGLDFQPLLDGFNEQWVEAAMFFSPALLIELLRLSGEWTAAFYGSVDPDRSCEPVGFFGDRGRSATSPYWQAIAREYVERWVHQHQIRRALGHPDLGREFLEPAAAVVARSLAAHLPDIGAEPGTVLVLTVNDVASWTCTLADGGWSLVDGRSRDAAVELSLAQADATVVLSRGRGRDDARAAFRVSGDEALAERALGVFSAMVAGGRQ
ncbi:MAG TPA: maleylpyruvate isomerase family mycothiol-dependent enzyme [Acidimicrobiales bacterium]|nr:maleylpyruvate isomerase family mycothiol-dependent enzyme [Acidimicrobiales bacterium]